jgi:hypothetical protein
MLVLALPGPTAAQDHVSLDQQGMEAYQLKDFARSADLFAQAVADAREDEPSRLYNAACTGALVGRTDAALGFLRRAIEAGYRDSAQFGEGHRPGVAAWRSTLARAACRIAGDAGT